MPARMMITLLENDSSDHLMQSSRTIEARTDTPAPTIASESSGGLFEQGVRSSIPSLHLLSSGDTSSINQGMEPALAITFNERNMGKEILTTEISPAEGTLTGYKGVSQSARDLSKLPTIDREKIPTPLGLTRCLILYERVNSFLLEQLP